MRYGRSIPVGVEPGRGPLSSWPRAATRPGRGPLTEAWRGRARQPKGLRNRTGHERKERDEGSGSIPLARLGAADHNAPVTKHSNTAEYNRSYYLRNRERKLAYEAARRKDPDVAERQRAHRRRHFEARAELVRAVKDAPCADCGGRFHPQSMDLDHRDGLQKAFDVSRGKLFGIERLRAEIAKCDVVCANCHRVRSMFDREAARDRYRPRWL